MTGPGPGLSADAVVARLRAAGCVFAEDEARLLISAASGPSELSELVDRRVTGVPLEHVLGWAEFCGLRIEVDPQVFVPRPRSEFLVAQAVLVTPRLGVAVDLCCGSGALGLALAASVSLGELHFADVDPVAVRCARRNAAGVGQVYLGDLYKALPDSLRGRVDVVIANVPYVPSGEVPFMPSEARDFEAQVALDGGADGLEVLRRVAAGASSWLVPGGHLLIETSERQAPAAEAEFASAGLRASVAYSDELGATVVIGALG